VPTKVVKKISLQKLLLKHFVHQNVEKEIGMKKMSNTNGKQHTK
jgi:hypothetical protein